MMNPANCDAFYAGLYDITEAEAYERLHPKCLRCDARYEPAHRGYSPRDHFLLCRDCADIAERIFLEWISLLFDLKYSEELMRRHILNPILQAYEARFGVRLEINEIDKKASTI